MADYYAHFYTSFRKTDGTRGNSWTETFPVVRADDEGLALVFDTDGYLKTVHVILAELRKGGDTPDEEGETYTVSLQVNTWAGE